MKGVIDKIWENKTKDGKKYWVLNIAGENYSVWDKKRMEGVQEGAAIEYEWAASGDFRKITDIKRIIPEGTFDPDGEYTPRDRRMIRMSCLKSATALLSDSEAAPDEKAEITLGVARKFEKYVLDSNGEEKKAANKKE